jgi:Zn-dependent protease
MSWEDREYADDPGRRFGRPGGDWQGVRPSFDNPMSWHVPFLRAFGIAVRIHVVFLLYVVIELGRSLRTDADFSFGLVALQMGCLFGIVLLHEFGHCFACRFSRGEANEILMWPLGGLAFCRPASQWQAHLITAVGGPLVNVLLCLLLAPVLALVCFDPWSAVFANPLALELPVLPSGRQPWWLLTIFFTNFFSLLLLLFNLLPIFPLDGGRICQALLWPRMDYARSMKITVRIGYVGAIGLFIFGVVFEAWMLIFIAVFGGITCYVTIKQLEFTDSVIGEPADVYAKSLWSSEEEEEKADEPRRPTRGEAKAQREAAAALSEAEEVDRILQKIGDAGMDSLSTRERRLLRRATERRQREEP